MNVLVTGANRGIGLAFTQYYLDQGANVWACYRSDKQQLDKIKNNRLQQVQWDVTQSAPTQGKETLPEQIDLLINNAGIYGPSKQAGQSLDSVTADTMLKVFDVDCVGTLRVVQHLLPRILKGQGRIANVSSKMGSSDDNTSGGCYAYRAAKAGLVIVSKSMAVDLAPQGVKVITLHPGWVQTDMTDHTGEIDVETSARGMAKVIDSIDSYPLGAFVAWDGEQVPF